MYFIEKRTVVYYLFLLCLASLTGGFVWNVVMQSSHKTAVNNNYDAFATQITATQFSDTGQKKYELLSPRLNHYNEHNQTRVNQPQLYIYNKDQEAWLITADYALVIQGDDIIEFIDNVDISGARTKNRKNTHLTTEEISYFPKKNIAHTDLPVTIVQPGFAVHAIGAEANFNTGEINLLSEIIGSYDPNVH